MKPKPKLAWAWVNLVEPWVWYTRLGKIYCINVKWKNGVLLLSGEVEHDPQLIVIHISRNQKGVKQSFTVLLILYITALVQHQRGDDFFPREPFLGVLLCD